MAHFKFVCNFYCSLKWRQNPWSRTRPQPWWFVDPREECWALLGDCLPQRKLGWSVPKQSTAFLIREGLRQQRTTAPVVWTAITLFTLWPYLGQLVAELIQLLLQRGLLLFRVHHLVTDLACGTYQHVSVTVIALDIFKNWWRKWERETGQILHSHIYCYC